MGFRTTMAVKIGLLAAVLIGFLMTLGGVGLVSLDTIDGRMAALTQDSMPGLEAVMLISSNLYRFRGDAWKCIASPNEEQKAKVEPEMSAARHAFEEEMTAYEKTIFTPLDRDNFDRLRLAAGRYFQAWDGVLLLSRQDKGLAYDKYLREVDPASQQVRYSLLVLQNLNREGEKRDSAAVRDTLRRVRFQTWSLLAASLLVACAVSFGIVRGVNKGLRRLTNQLTVEAARITESAAQVASSGLSMARGASDQAASLEETSASSEQSIRWPNGIRKTRSRPRKWSPVRSISSA